MSKQKFKTNLNVDQKVSEPSFFEEAHQIRGERLSLVGRNFRDLSRLAHHVAAFDGLELQVPRDASMDQKLDQLEK
jgi:hypothetical protein